MMMEKISYKASCKRADSTAEIRTAHSLQRRSQTWTDFGQLSNLSQVDRTVQMSNLGRDNNFSENVESWMCCNCKDFKEGGTVVGM